MYIQAAAIGGVMPWLTPPLDEVADCVGVGLAVEAQPTIANTTEAATAA